ncbi:MAG: tetratricopeptide repeat protein, partial [Burkholderiaceae bacterium]|nr:tetratricopeptide repeat protein [Burkholderiaceae bacterium]
MKKPNAPRNRSKAQLLIDAAAKRIAALFVQERYEEALASCQQLMRTHPEVSVAWIDAAVCCIHLERWQDAIRYAQTALTRGEQNNLSVYDALAHVSGKLGQWDDVRRYGLQALGMRARRFGGEPVIPLLEPGSMPPPPSAQTRQHNVI